MTERSSVDPEVLADMVRSETLKANPDKLSLVKKAAVKAANLELEIKDLEERLAEARSALHVVTAVELPDLLTQAGMSEFTLKPSGNLPPKKFKLSPYYSANIAVGWPEERRSRALKSLEENDASWLIKTEVSIRFPQHEREIAKMFIDQLGHGGYDFQVKESVHHGQLTKWLRGRIEEGKSYPPLDDIGASVGQRVVISDVE